MDRQDLIKEEGNRFMLPILHHSMETLMKKYKINEKIILESFQNALKELYLQAEVLQSHERKGSVSYLGICYCLSSVYTGNYELRLDLYDEEFYLDENVCCVYWNPDFIVSHLKEDISYFQRTIRQRVPRVKMYEEQTYVAGYMRNYMYVALEFLKQKMPIVLEQVEKDTIKMAKELHVFFGEYMGRCTTVYLYSA